MLMLDFPFVLYRILRITHGLDGLHGLCRNSQAPRKSSLANNLHQAIEEQRSYSCR